MQIAVAASFSNINSVARSSAPQLAISVAVGALSLSARSLGGTTVFFLPALAVLPDFVSRSLDDWFTRVVDCARFRSCQCIRKRLSSFSADCDELLAHTRRCGLASLERICHKIIILRDVVVFAVQVFPSIHHVRDTLSYVLRCILVREAVHHAKAVKFVENLLGKLNVQTERICFVLRRHETTHFRFIRVALHQSHRLLRGRSGLELDHRRDHHAERRLVDASTCLLLSCSHALLLQTCFVVDVFVINVTLVGRENQATHKHCVVEKCLLPVLDNALLLKRVKSSLAPAGEIDASTLSLTSNRFCYPQRFNSFAMISMGKGRLNSTIQDLGRSNIGIRIVLTKELCVCSSNLLFSLFSS
ncbi:hypothetical protein KC354_g162 [Hortaea werneckii]|nr:hypothetical protein KC354_g162 [Hortaea werneckii]